MKVKFKTLTDWQGRVHAVNPKYVTALEAMESQCPYSTEVWVTGHGGYGTFSIKVHDNVETVKKYLEG